MARSTASFLFAMAASVLISTGPTFAQVVKINQAAALAGDVTPGDSPGFPVTISEPGMYRLTGHLDVTESPSPSTTDAIVVQVDHVEINLGGFAIESAGIAGPGKGVSGRLSGARFTTVRNGSILRVGDDAIDLGENAVVADLRIQTQNGTVILGAGSRISNCVISGIGPVFRGIFLNGLGIKVNNNIVENAMQGGINQNPSIPSSGLITGNVVRDTLVGIDVPNALLIDNFVE